MAGPVQLDVAPWETSAPQNSQPTNSNSLSVAPWEKPEDVQALQQQTDTQTLSDARQSNPGLDDTSMAGDVHAYLNSLPADQRQAAAMQGLKDTLKVGALGAATLATAGGAGSLYEALPATAKTLFKFLGVPSGEELAGHLLKKGADALGISEINPYIDKAVLLGQLLSPGYVGKGVAAEKILQKAAPASNEAMEQVPAASMESVEPDPTMVTSPYTTGLSYQHQGQGYQASPSGLLLPH